MYYEYYLLLRSYCYLIGLSYLLFSSSYYLYTGLTFSLYVPALCINMNPRFLLACFCRPFVHSLRSPCRYASTHYHSPSARPVRERNVRDERRTGPTAEASGETVRWAKWGERGVTPGDTSKGRKEQGSVDPQLMRFLPEKSSIISCV